MDQIQANIEEMRNQMDVRMAQFVEVITNVTRNQEELRALMERPHVENEQPELIFEDVSVGRPCPNVALNFVGPNFNDQYANGYHACNQGLHGNFPTSTTIVQPWRTTYHCWGHAEGIPM